MGYVCYHKINSCSLFDNVMLPVIKMSMQIFVAYISIILLRIVCDVSRAGLVFFGMSLMAVHVQGLNSICQSFCQCSNDDWSDSCCWGLSVVMLLKRSQSVENNFCRRGFYEGSYDGEALGHPRRDVSLGGMYLSSRTSSVMLAQHQGIFKYGRQQI